MSESKVDWNKCPDAEFFAFGEFRKERSRSGCTGVDYWFFDEEQWVEGAFTLAECKEASDYEERPPQYDQSQDEKWDTGELGRDEEYVGVAELPASVVKDPVYTQHVTPEALTKAADQAKFLHKKHKTSVDFLNTVKDIQEERGAEYEQDGGERSFAKIAEVFNIYRGKDLLPSDIALILEIMKNVRFYAQDRYHLDSVIDKVSYGSLWAELVTQERT